MNSRSYLIAIAALPLAASMANAQMGAVRQELLPGNTAGNTIAGSVRELDTSSPLTPIGFTIDFFGAPESALYVNTHGNVTFGHPRGDVFVPQILQGKTDVRIIAPFFADHFPERGNRAITYGRGKVDGRPAFFVNWIGLGYYIDAGTPPPPDKVNSHQLVLIERSDTGPGNFDIEFNYGTIQWEASGPGESQGGRNGLCAGQPSCIPAGVGWSNGLGGGNNQSFELPGSRVPNSFLDSSPQPLIRRQMNSNVAGRLVFFARNGLIAPTPTPTPSPIPEPVTLQLTQLVPSTTAAGSPTFTMEARGSGFLPGAVVKWRPGESAISLTTTFVSATTLRAVVPASLVTTANTASVFVENVCVGPPYICSTNSLPFTSTQSLRITQLDPNSAIAGSPGVAMRVIGEGFTPGAQVRWTPIGGAPQVLPAQVVSLTELRTAVPGGLLGTPGTAFVEVVLPGLASTTQGAVSNALPFVVSVPLSISSLGPDSRIANTGDFMLTINGTGFTSIARVMFGPRVLVPATSDISSTQIRVLVPNSDILSPGNVQVSVQVAGAVSNPATFRILTPLSITSLMPESRPAGSAAFDLTVIGTGFAEGARVLFGSASLVPSSRSATQMVVTVPAHLIASAGQVPVIAELPAGTRSASRMFNVTAGLVISSLSPSMRPANSGDFQLVVSGTGFTANAQVLFGSTPLAAVSRSATQIIVNVPASLLGAPGQIAVRVQAPGGVQSAPVSFSVTAQLTLSSVSPSSALAGSGGLVLTIHGSGFTGGAEVLFGGAVLNPSTRSETQMTVSIDAALLATAGQVPVRVRLPGGLQSGTIQFQILPAVPGITSLDPASVRAGSGPFTLTVHGSNFRPGAAIRWNGQDLVTTLGSASRLTAAVPPERITVPGQVEIVVVAADGASSNASLFRIEMPPVTAEVNGSAPIVEAARGSTVTVTLADAAFVPMSGRLELRFRPDAAAVPADYRDPAMQFASGGTQASFTIAAGEKAAKVDREGAFSAGTVAGTITAAIASLAAGSQPLQLVSQPFTTINVLRAAPVIVPGSVRIVPNAGGFAVELIGYSSPREITEVSLSFAASSSVDVDGAGAFTLTSEVAQQFSAWFDSAPGRSAGSAFKLSIPFRIDGADASVIESVTAILTNSLGRSQPATGTR